MPATISRKYNNKDIEMLTAAQTLIKNALDNKTFLISKRTTWADPFFNDLKIHIQTTTDTYLGKDAAIILRDATQVVLNIQQQALFDIAEIKIQIQEDFKSTPTKRTEILKQLGITTYHKMAQNRDQEALVNLLYQFKDSLTPALRALLISKGIASIIMTKITDHTATLNQANIDQETFKGNRTEMTDQAIIAFNDVYEKIISIAKISNNFFKLDKTKQQLFSFSKIVATLNNKPPKP